MSETKRKNISEQDAVLDLSEDELFEMAEYGIQARIDSRKQGKVNDHPQFLFNVFEVIDEDSLKACISEHSTRYKLEKNSQISTILLFINTRLLHLLCHKLVGSCNVKRYKLNAPQRARNENTNGLIRRFLPKSSSI